MRQPQPVVWHFSRRFAYPSSAFALFQKGIAFFAVLRASSAWPALVLVVWLCGLLVVWLFGWLVCWFVGVWLLWLWLCVCGEGQVKEGGVCEERGEGRLAVLWWLRL